MSTEEKKVYARQLTLVYLQSHPDILGRLIDLPNSVENVAKINKMFLEGLKQSDFDEL